MRRHCVRNARLIPHAIDLSDEPKADAAHGAYVRLSLAFVAQGAPRRADAGVDGGIRNGSAAPDDLDQLVLADNAMAVLDEASEQAENLPLEMTEFAAPPKLLTFGVKHERIVAINHVSHCSTRIKRS